MHTADQLRGCHGRSAFRRNRRIIAWLGGHSALQDLDNLRTVLVSFASVWWCGFLRAASILHRLVDSAEMAKLSVRPATLLAIVHGAVKGPRDIDQWAELWEADQLPIDDIRQHLERYRSRFDLLHQETPFFQVARLHTAKGDMSDLSKLVADIPNGHPFFSTRLDPDLSLSFAEAARRVVHCQAFDSSGIKSGAVGDERVKGGRGYPIGTGWAGLLGRLLPEGATLRETLLLNLTVRDYEPLARWSATDSPVWEGEPAGSADQRVGGRATGFVDLYTWHSRRIRLAHDGQRVTGVLICNGDRRTPQNQHIVEPHGVAAQQAARAETQATAGLYAQGTQSERGIWRGLQALLPGAEKSQKGDARHHCPR
jgi:CRISPR system Cascade subunit CasA